MCDELMSTRTLDVEPGAAASTDEARFGDLDLVVTSAAFARARDPWGAMAKVSRLLASRRGTLLWHEPFARADQRGGDLWRFTTSAATSIAASAGLAVMELSADGGYGAVLCDTIGLPPDDSRLWGAEGLSRGVEASTKRGGGHYAATAMVARWTA